METKLKAQASDILLTGWVDADETWTYASADDPTYTLTISGDKTSKYSAGMRVKLTQTTDKYFIITAVSYSSSNTTLTLYGGTDYDLANATITSPAFSVMKAPYGFPLNPSKWTEEFRNETDQSQSSPTNGTVYNPGSTLLSVPIGAWKLRFQVTFSITLASSGTMAPYVGLGTTSSSLSNEWQYYLRQDNLLRHIAGIVKENYINLTSKQIYYLNCKVATTTSTISYVGSIGATVIRATCAYL